MFLPQMYFVCIMICAERTLHVPPFRGTCRVRDLEEQLRTRSECDDGAFPSSQVTLQPAIAGASSASPVPPAAATAYLPNATAMANGVAATAAAPAINYAQGANTSSHSTTRSGSVTVPSVMPAESSRSGRADGGGAVGQGSGDGVDAGTVGGTGNLTHGRRSNNNNGVLAPLPPVRTSTAPAGERVGVTGSSTMSSDASSPSSVAAPFAKKPARGGSGSLASFYDGATDDAEEELAVDVGESEPRVDSPSKFVLRVQPLSTQGTGRSPSRQAEAPPAVQQQQQAEERAERRAKRQAVSKVGDEPAQGQTSLEGAGATNAGGSAEKSVVQASGVTGVTASEAITSAVAGQGVTVPIHPTMDKAAKAVGASPSPVEHVAKATVSTDPTATNVHYQGITTSQAKAIGNPSSITSRGGGNSGEHPGTEPDPITSQRLASGVPMTGVASTERKTGATPAAESVIGQPAAAVAEINAGSAETGSVAVPRSDLKKDAAVASPGDTRGNDGIEELKQTAEPLAHITAVSSTDHYGEGLGENDDDDAGVLL